MDPSKLSQYLKDHGEPKYRSSQVLKALCAGVSSYEDISTLPKELRQGLQAKLPVLSFEVAALRSADNHSAFKARLLLADGKEIESVLMQSKPGHWSVCVSSQVGCALACNFCATGLMGFTRNLSAEEITDQLLFWRAHMRKLKISARISNVVYMGMGEPMLNFDAVKESVLNLMNPQLFAMGARSIAVSTAGVIPGIDRFSKELKQVHLALSLHAANNELRSRLVPINRAYPLADLRRALKRYFALNKRKVFIEYVLLEGENDSPEHAQELIDFIKSTGTPHLLHVNLIAWNPTATAHQQGDKSKTIHFKLTLERKAVSVTIRKNLGREIEGACGQLLVEEKS